MKRNHVSTGKNVAALVLGLLVMSGVAQAKGWTGGDDLPTSPLACDATPANVAAKPYDGGTVKNAPDLKGKQASIIDVPKLIGIGYFNATAKGVAEGAKDLGNVTAKTDGPTKANIDDQITMIDNYITSGVNGILFAANDPVAIAPVLKKAMSKGIHVVGYDSNSSVDAREWFVNQASFNGVAKALMDNLASQIGEDGAFAIVTSTFTTPVQARWIAEMAAYTEKCHPKMKWLETVEAQEDNILSFNQANTLMNKHGKTLKGLIGMTSVATPAAAEAITQTNKCGQIAVTGLALPNSMKPYVNKGCVKSVVLWNPSDLGYAATQVLRAAIDGTLKPGATSVKAGKLGELQIVNGSEVLLGSPTVFTKDNINQFDF
ncbi:MAG: substrate-binding domain-containing protein [Propionivibrio sp.]|jgi:rhamnose transport system substrate-binding protein|uniref:autoinducer 2 ABC transporter substrate-binding protein n=1 Tax=Propionivibrio sp. TaxID=2212460 RepID=UPI001B67FE5D|nr:substrate-binding domain-containing protein [Propionivibrio sp.]MBP7204182.1 substrate-binding domain-containing protein [Propionivibrio sp.]